MKPPCSRGPMPPRILSSYPEPALFQNTSKKFVACGCASLGSLWCTSRHPGLLAAASHLVRNPSIYAVASSATRYLSLLDLVRFEFELDRLLGNFIDGR